jgi:alkylglycerol monooxygenase
MMMVIKSNFVWEDTQERCIVAFLLWFQIIKWSGILESKSWLFMSELIRISLALGCVLMFSHLSLPLSFGFVVMAIYQHYGH